MSDDRTKVLQRILNLRAKGDNDASSEAEMLAAMERAERLMHAYRVDEAELALAEAQGEIKVEIIHKMGRSLKVGNGYKNTQHVAAMCSYAIGELTNTKAVWYGGVQPECTGTPADVDYAHFLQDLIAEAMDREYARYKREAGIVGRGAKRSFQLSMSRRINARLAEMLQARVAETKAAKAAEAKRLEVDLSVIESMVVPEARAELTSTALVMIAHDERVKLEVERAYNERHPRLGGGRRFSLQSRNGTAAAAGYAAGSRVHLGRSIGGSQGSISQ